MASSTTTWYATKISSLTIYPSWALLAPRSRQGSSFKISWRHPSKKIRKFAPAEQLVLAVPSPAADWREQFIKYLTSADVPADKTKTEHLIH